MKNMELKKSDSQSFTVGERLKAARKEVGLNQSTFAEMVDMSLRGYQANEQDVSNPSTVVLKKFAELGVSPLWLLTGNGNMMLDKTSKQIYEDADNSATETKAIVDALNLIFDNLMETTPPETKINNTHEIYDEIGIKNHVAFHKLISELSEPFKSFYLLPVINPKNESAFHDFGSDLDLYSFHPVRRSWVANKKLKPEHLKAVFPSDDAMAPTINQGEIAIIDDRAALSCSGLYALSFQDKVVIRRVEQRISGLVIMTDSEHYSNEVLSDDDAKKVSVLGRVVRIDSYSE